MKISKCCGAEIKQRYMSRTDNVGEMYCTKCDRECEVIECDTIEQPMQNTPTPMQKKAYTIVIKEAINKMIKEKKK